MSGTDPEVTPTEAEALAPVVAEPVEAPPTLEPPAPPPAPPSLVASAAAVPLGRRLWTAALAAALLVTCAGLGLLYLDDSNAQDANHSLTNQNASLRGQNDLLQTDLTTAKDTLAKTQAVLATTQADLMHPNLGIWNVAQSLTNASEELVAGVPDTFTYHLKLTSNAPVSVSILTWHQFGDAIYCIRTGVGNTDYCMHRASAVNFPHVTSVNYDFHLAEGCAAYVLVITAANPATVKPDVSVTYNPASQATGTCA
jgi:hypothetical protein